MDDQEAMAPNQGVASQEGTGVLPEGSPALEGNGSDETGAGVSVSDTQNPASLDEAFRMLRQGDGAGASQDVQEPGTEGNAGSGAGEDANAGGSTAPQQEPQEAVSPGQGAAPQGQPSQGGAGQAPVQQQQPTVSANDIRVILQNQAVNMTRKEFSDRDIRHITINDLYKNDEQTGRVTFINPDDPNRPFSSRMEAQDFVNAWNQQIDDEMRAYATEVYKQLQDDEADVIRLVEFNPTYQAMPPVVQQTFEALLQPYQTTNSQGQIVFPGADFNRLHQQAINIVQLNAARGRQAQQSQAPQAQSQPHTPAVDLKSGSSGAKKNDRPPRTLGEAMQRVNEEKKALRQKKGKK